MAEEMKRGARMIAEAALEDNLDKFEAQFGESDEPRGQFADPDDFGFVH